MANNGEKIVAEYSGIYAANGNTKSLQVFVNGTGISTNTSTANAGSWYLRILMIRTGTTTARVVTNFRATGTGDPTCYDLTGLDFTTAITFAIWGASGSGTVGDITAKLGSIKWEAAAPQNT
jgi:hypothetical protein